MNIAELEEKTNEELRALAREMGVISDGASPKRRDLMMRVLQGYSERNGNVMASGVLSIEDQGYGFLQASGRRNGAGTVYVSQSQIRRFSLRTGDKVAGQVRAPKDGERYFGLVRVEAVNGVEPETARRRPHFENLTPIFPDERIRMETDRRQLSTRIIDLVCPIGRGQRGLIVSPPKVGKTTILKDIAASISANAPDMHLMVALIGERPEEVTDMTRSVDGEVFSSTFDEPVEYHCKVAELVLNRAKRLVETGGDVVILLDSITRLTRAYNLAVPSSGRTLSGGMDPVALYPPKQFFGAARNVENGGSLTILAACLVETDSRMDELIYEELKGTGNMEVRLDRRLAEKRVYPAIDIGRSGTRREELLLEPEVLRQTWLLRRMVALITSDGMASEATEKVLERLRKTKDNDEFLLNLAKDGG